MDADRSTPGEGYPDDLIDSADVDAFWRDARVRAGFTAIPGYLGVTTLEVLTPPAWCFGATPTQADDLLELVLEGTKTATAGALWDYQAEDEPLPVADSLAILCDGSGRPRALIRTTEVRVVPFNEVNGEHAWLEGEGDRSLVTWQKVHQDFFTRYAEHDRSFAADMPVVLERFEVLFANRR